MKGKAFVVLTIAAALVILLGGTSGVMAGPQQQGLGGGGGGGTGYVTLPAAAFTPGADGYDFVSFGSSLEYFGGALGWYYAPVSLPQGATVTKMTFYFYDASTSSNEYTYLYRTDLVSNATDQMAYVDSYFAGGYGARSDDTIAYATVDNSRYMYYLFWQLPDSPGYPSTYRAWARAVVIEYNYPVYLSTVQRQSP
jgi:hypothetical protein